MNRSPFPETDALWQEIAALYAKPDAIARCRRLQDGYGLCIPAVLVAIALSHRGICIHEGAKTPLRQILHQWHYPVLIPLRQARRGLAAVDPEGAGNLLAIELGIEREMTGALVSALRGRALWNAEDVEVRNIAVMVDAHGDDAPEPVYAAVENLARLLARDA